MKYKGYNLKTIPRKVSSKIIKKSKSMITSSDFYNNQILIEMGREMIMITAIEPIKKYQGMIFTNHSNPEIAKAEPDNQDNFSYTFLFMHIDYSKHKNGESNEKNITDRGSLISSRCI